jgi:hypothetical protein
MIEGGRATVSIPEPLPRDLRSLSQDAKSELQSVFQARQLIVHRSFKLEAPSVTRHRSDGGRDAVALVEAARSEWHVGRIDVVVRDATGRVTRDTRAGRVASETARLQLLAAKLPESETLRRMLQSYSRAVEDPGNELVHLYEVRDAVDSHFGGHAAARSALGLTAAEWNHLGMLANAKPVREGRHRGRQPSLRHATKEELADARRIALRMIEAFAATV